MRIQPPAPTRVFSGRPEIPVGRLTATAIDLGAQHSEGDTVVWVPQDRVLFAGDLLFIVARIAAGVQQKPRLRPLQPGERDGATDAWVQTPGFPGIPAN